MRRFLIRWIITALALYAAVRWVPGIDFEGGWTTLAAMALFVGFVNAVVRPFVTILSCPLILVSLGLFTLVINGAMLLLASRLAGWMGVGFYVQGFGAAFLGAVVISAVSFFLSLLFPDDRREHRSGHRR